MAKVTGGQDQAELITLALIGLDVQIRELQEKRAQLAALVGSSSSPKAAPVAAPKAAAAPAAAAAPSAAPAGKKRVFSAATRKKLKIAAKRRWERKRAEEKAAAKAAPKAGKAVKSAKSAKAEKASKSE